jgi:hypothetical protein
MSERRACTLIAADRTMVRYRSRRPPETVLRARLREVANQRRRFGYRRLFILLRREGTTSADLSQSACMTVAPGTCRRRPGSTQRAHTLARRHGRQSDRRAA